MQTVQTSFPKITVGVDVGDRKSVAVEVDGAGAVVARNVFPTTPAGVRRYFGKRERCRVVIESGTHAPWMAREIEAAGHEMVVANASLIHVPGRRKNDPKDAERLARQGRADVELLHPIRARSAAAQEDLALLRARDQLVSARTKLINHVRGSVKSMGGRIAMTSAEAFVKRARKELPEELWAALFPLLDVIEQLSVEIWNYDRQVEALATTTYPESNRLRQIKGVGALTAVAFMLLVDDPRRFEHSRDVGAYFGLVQKLVDSGDSTPQLRISKAGDELGRRLLVSAAHYILGPFGPECDLRRHGEALMARGGKNAKKRAVVAVARKLAVLLHRLWVSGDAYDPNHVRDLHLRYEQKRLARAG